MAPTAGQGPTSPPSTARAINCGSRSWSPSASAATLGTRATGDGDGRQARKVRACVWVDCSFCCGAHSPDRATLRVRAHRPAITRRSRRVPTPIGRRRDPSTICRGTPPVVPLDRNGGRCSRRTPMDDPDERPTPPVGHRWTSPLVMCAVAAGLVVASGGVLVGCVPPRRLRTRGAELVVGDVVRRQPRLRRRRDGAAPRPGRRLLGSCFVVIGAAATVIAIATQYDGTSASTPAPDGTGVASADRWARPLGAGVLVGLVPWLLLAHRRATAGWPGRSPRSPSVCW